MKRIFLLIISDILLIINTEVYSQHTDLYGTNFDQPNSELVSVFIDHTNPENIWVAGNPKKNFFRLNHPFDTFSMSTLLTGSYPINNKSSFTVVFNPILLENIEKFSLRFSYQIDTDTLNDYGYIEVSPDLGETWDNLSSNQSKYALYRLIRGNEYDSYYFSGRDVIMYNGLANIGFGIKGDFLKCNTLMFRFNFISDSIDTQKEGWCINEVMLSVMRGNGIEKKEKNHNNIINIYPNPNTGKFIIYSKSALSLIEVYNLTGKLLYSDCNLKRQTLLEIDLSDLQKGIYYTRLQNGKHVMTEKIIIQ